MSKSLYSNPTAKAHLSKHGHDLSQVKKFSSTVGEIRPVYMDFLNPNEDVTLQFNLETLMEPLRNPSFVNLETSIDVFFVPIEQIYAPFETMFYGIKDFHTSWMSDAYEINNPPSAANYPTIAIKSLQDVIKNGSHTVVDYFYDIDRKIYDSARLLDALELPVWNMFESFMGGAFASDNTPISLWFACAYQKIFYDHYRLTDITPNKTRAYSLDVFFGGLSQISAIDIKDFFEMHYIPYRKDYFTNWFPAPYLASPVSQNTDTDLTNINLFGGVSYAPDMTKLPAFQQGGSVSAGAAPLSSPAAGVNIPAGSFSSLQGGLNINQLRSAFAMQKLLEVTRRAGKHIDAQTLAHFGVKPSAEASGHCRFCGSVSDQIQMKGLLSSSSAEGEPLGTRAGSGFGNLNSGKIKVSSGGKHGILMAVMYTRPLVDYYQNSLSRLHRLTGRDKFYIPEYDKLGMQPMFASDAYYDFVTPDNNANIAAWQYRYSEFKTKVDLVSGKFMSGNRDWTLGRTPWLLPQSQTTPIQNAQINRYVSPCDINSIVHVGFSTEIFGEEDNQASAPIFGALYNTDPLLHKLSVNAKKVSTMSVYGLEDL